jgi:hypothetical protein
MNIVVGWALTLIIANYAIHALTGYSLVWCWLNQAAQPLGYYATIVNLSMAVGIVAGGMWYGPVGALKMAVLLFVFNLVPAVLEALMGFGCRCG